MHLFLFHEFQLSTVLLLIRNSYMSCGIFHFRFRLVLIKFYIFVQQKAWALTLNRHDLF